MAGISEKLGVADGRVPPAIDGRLCETRDRTGHFGTLGTFHSLCRKPIFEFGRRARFMAARFCAF